jgi:aminopeptidase N
MPYIQAVYFNGAKFLHALRVLVGEEDWNAFLQDYLATYAYRQATGEEFFLLLEAHTQADFHPLVREYFQP